MCPSDRIRCRWANSVKIGFRRGAILMGVKIVQQEDNGGLSQIVDLAAAPVPRIL